MDEEVWEKLIKFLETELRMHKHNLLIESKVEEKVRLKPNATYKKKQDNTPYWLIKSSTKMPLLLYRQWPYQIIDQTAQKLYSTLLVRNFAWWNQETNFLQ